MTHPHDETVMISGIIAARVLEDLARRRQSARNDRGMVMLSAESGVSAATGTPMVQIQVGTSMVQVSPAQATAFGHMIVEAAAGADCDAALYAVVRRTADDPRVAATLLLEIRAERDKRAATPVTSG